jgi:uncharacterized protein (TIGR00725 family)
MTRDRARAGDPNEAPVYVAVCGPGTDDPEAEARAEEVGRLLAAEGAVVVCGGMTGVMEAVARGAAERGGVSIGILPGVDRSEANPHITYAVPSGFGEARNTLVVRAADAVIAVAGEYGTLSEIAFALKIGVPVVGLGTWQLHKEGRPVDAFPSVTTPEAAVEEALRRARARRRRTTT